MALDHDGLFSVIGKFVKTINTVNAYIGALDSAQGEIYTILNTEGLEDYYSRPVSIPDQFDSFQGQVSQWIAQLIANVQSVLLDNDYVVDQLNLYQFSVTDVLNGLYDYMIEQNETIKSSVVTLNASDVDKAASITLPLDSEPLMPVLFVSRTLDGVNSPGNNAAAHLRYDGIESQLAMDCTAYAELLTNTTPGSETAQLFSGIQAVSPYQILTEDPGKGPVLVNPEASNLVPVNYDFSEWTSTNVPSNWSMSGTHTTDYDDESGTGAGPIRLLTQGVTALQKIESLQHNRLYFFGLSFYFGNVSAATNTVGIKLRTLADSTIVTQATISSTQTAYGIAYTFFRLPSTVNLTDIYIEVEYVAEGGTSDVVKLFKVVISPATYWNGLGWAWWPTRNLLSDISYAPLGNRTSMTVANNDAGVFQTFFRKAFAVQLPTADSPSNTIDEAFAT